MIMTPVPLVGELASSRLRPLTPLSLKLSLAGMKRPMMIIPIDVLQWGPPSIGREIALFRDDAPADGA